MKQLFKARLFKAKLFRVKLYFFLKGTLCNMMKSLGKGILHGFIFQS